MAEGSNLPVLHARGGGEKKRQGRPKGAKNKTASKTKRAQADMYRYYEAQYGTTPGQQRADLFLVSPRDIRLAKAWVKAGGWAELYRLRHVIPEVSMFTPLQIAHKFKLYQLGVLFDLTPKEALAFWAKMTGDDMAYVHNRQGSLEPAGDPDSDYAPIEGIPVDASFLANVPQNQQLDLGLDDYLTPGTAHPDE